jgi:hypothetical protein
MSRKKRKRLVDRFELDQDRKVAAIAMATGHEKGIKRKLE